MEDSLTLEIEMTGNRPSGKTETANPLIQRALASSKVSGKEPELYSTRDKYEFN